MAGGALALGEHAHRSMAQTMAVEAALHRRLDRARRLMRELRMARVALDDDVVAVGELDGRGVVLCLRDVAVAQRRADGFVNL